jgi:hypothetical protein
MDDGDEKAPRGKRAAESAGNILGTVPASHYWYEY